MKQLLRKEKEANTTAGIAEFRKTGSILQYLYRNGVLLESLQIPMYVNVRVVVALRTSLSIL